MSYNIFPSSGREAYKTRQHWNLSSPITALEPLAETSVINSGWNDPVMLSLSGSQGFAAGKREPRWESPTVNVLPSATTESMMHNSRPFGRTATPVAKPLPPLPRTPLQSMVRRSEHWYSDPIHGVFVNCVPEDPGRWTTSNRNVFHERLGVTNSVHSDSVLMRMTAALNGQPVQSVHSFAKPQLSRSQHCWERINGVD